MKKIILSLTVLLSVGSAYGQTAEKLMEKYKAVPGAKYENTTKEILEGLEKEDSILSAEDIAKLKKHFKKSEQVQIQNACEELLAQINKDIKALKGHELLFETNRNTESELAENALLQMVSDFMNPNIKMQCYGKVDGKMISDLLIRVDIWNTMALSHIDTKIDRDIWMRVLEKYNDAISDNETVDNVVVNDIVDDVVDDVVVEDADHNKDDIVDMRSVLQEVKKGNALIVINGEKHPELHSEKDATEYMGAHNISWNYESWVVGGAVKEKYPNTDKKVVIEFSRQEKEQK